MQKDHLVLIGQNIDSKIRSLVNSFNLHFVVKIYASCGSQEELQLKYLCILIICICKFEKTLSMYQVT